MKVELSAHAEADLEDIALYIARDDPEAAEAWVNRLMVAAGKASLAPLAGRMVPETDDPAIREVLLRNYRIIYRVERARILILTIVEGHRRLRGLP